MHMIYIFHVALTFNKRSCETITVAATTLSEVPPQIKRLQIFKNSFNCKL